MRPRTSHAALNHAGYKRASRRCPACPFVARSVPTAATHPAPVPFGIAVLCALVFLDRRLPRAGFTARVLLYKSWQCSPGLQPYYTTRKPQMQAVINTESWLRQGFLREDSFHLCVQESRLWRANGHHQASCRPQLPACRFKARAVLYRCTAAPLKSCCGRCRPGRCLPCSASPGSCTQLP